MIELLCKQGELVSKTDDQDLVLPSASYDFVEKEWFQATSGIEWEEHLFQKLVWSLIWSAVIIEPDLNLNLSARCVLPACGLTQPVVSYIWRSSF